MITAGLQSEIDKLIDRLILRFIPYSVKPNFFSYLRIFLVPVIYYLLETNNYSVAFPMFIFAASTDFIDGALARRRNQITDLGKILDPIADKMLILTVLVFIGFEYFIVKLFVIIILFEVVANLSSALFAKYLGKPIGANVYGKIKMILQCVCVGLFLLGILIDDQKIILISQVVLYLALVFALLAGIEQVKRRIAFKIDKKSKIK